MSDLFDQLDLRAELLQAVSELGFETPTPIQARTIPLLLAGRDVIGQAQTGTGKTAAYALPLLQRVDPRLRAVQALVLAPTRELALQVSKAIESFSTRMGVSVAAVYGGQSYVRQIGAIKGGANVVVGTPGRLIDLIERGVLNLSGVRYLVLDEADEMLKMGFVEDVERILAETPSDRQTALFSATMPAPIRRLADRYMHTPENVSIEGDSVTVSQTEQRYYLIHEDSKLAALARLIEMEEIKSALIFARTKLRTTELAEALLARGFQAEALNGDLSQDVRETVLRRFRNGQLVYLVATDVVARGVDIPSVSHVINFDLPRDPEDYVHRIGRTGRAGRTGIALTLVTPREGRWLRTIEDYTRQRITRANLPSSEDVVLRRDERFVDSLSAFIDGDPLEREIALVAELAHAGYGPQEIAAAAIRMARAFEFQRPIEDIRPARDQHERYTERSRSFEPAAGGGRPGRREAETGMVRLMIDAGREDGIRPGDIVGAVAGETGISGKSIGAIDIQRSQTYFDVKEQHVDHVLRKMARWTYRGRALTMTRAAGGGEHAPSRRPRPERV